MDFLILPIGSVWLIADDCVIFALKVYLMKLEEFKS